MNLFLQIIGGAVVTIIAVYIGFSVLQFLYFAVAGMVAYWKLWNATPPEGFKSNRKPAIHKRICFTVRYGFSLSWDFLTGTAYMSERSSHYGTITTTSKGVSFNPALKLMRFEPASEDEE